MRATLANGKQVFLCDPNGARVHLSLWLKKALENQDVDSWQKTPGQFNDWLQDCLRQRLANTEFVIESPITKLPNET